MITYLQETWKIPTKLHIVPLYITIIFYFYLFIFLQLFFKVNKLRYLVEFQYQIQKLIE